jgi:hypothetical protein
MKNEIKAVSLVCAVLAASVLAFSACEQPTDNGGGGSGGVVPVSDAIVIYSGADMAKIGGSADWPLDGVYELGADIDLDSFAPWTPIGTSMPDGTLFAATGKEFTGSFNGKGHTIRNLRLNADAPYIGLFGYVRQAVVENFTLELAEAALDVSAGGRYNIYLGAVAGFAHASTIRNVSVRGADGGGFSVSVTDTPTFYAGGIVGNAAVAVKNCSVRGVVSVSSVIDTVNNAGFAVGGIAGYSTSLIASCESSADVTVTGGDVTASQQNTSFYVGGIVGQLVGTAALPTEVRDSSATGNMDVRIAAVGAGIVCYTGGIVGSGSMNSSTAILAFISRSYTSGNIAARISSAYTAATAANLSASGISARYCAAKECYSTGNVEAEFISGVATSVVNVYAAGIAAMDGSAEDCYSTGGVSAKTSGATFTAATMKVLASGIQASASQAYFPVARCYATGAVSVESGSPGGATSCAGGITGAATTGKAVYNAAYNSEVTMDDSTSGTNKKAYRIGSRTSGVFTGNIAWDELDGDSAAGGENGTDKSYLELERESTYANAIDAYEPGLGWNFAPVSGVWKWDSIKRLPILQWQ